MKKRRIIPRFDVKGPNVVKGIQLEGLRVVGKPAEFARKYFEQGADEIIYIDIVASLYERNSLLEIIKEAAALGISIPLTVGGGIRKLDDIVQILRAGADKVAINTAATRDPEFITQAARMFGSQCIVGSVQAKRVGENRWEALVDNGREQTGLDAVAWAKHLVKLGAGELLITSVDQEGTKKGYDLELINRIVDHVSVPIISCGGAGSGDDVFDCLNQTGCDAVSFASILHYNETTIEQIKAQLSEKNIPVRQAYAQSKSKASPQLERPKVSVIDYGLGNLRSVTNAFEVLGYPVEVVEDASSLLNAELLILPGVGAFFDGMKGLESRDLINPLRDYVASGRSLLGICLGMQLLMSESMEFGCHEGLGLIKGQVVEFWSQDKVKDRAYRVPHVGWNPLIQPESVNWSETLLHETPQETDAYFVHSFKVEPQETNHILASTIYGQQTFCSVIKKDNIIGTQFHPEKSGLAGMRMLDQFCQQAFKGVYA